MNPPPAPPVPVVPPPVPRPAAAPPAPPVPSVVPSATPARQSTPPAVPTAAPIVRPGSSLTPPALIPRTAADSISALPRDTVRPLTHAPKDEPADDRAPLPPGTKLRNYTITARLGQGGYGITYRAQHSTKGSPVVIKEHMPLGMAVRDPGSTEVSFTSSREEQRFYATMAEFLEEITVLRALEYPGIVPIIDSFEANDTAYYVMPYIAGITLQAPEKKSLDINRQRIQAQRTKRLLNSLLCTLEYMEMHHIVHRDIKPDNILITAEGKPILLDFGSARQVTPGKVFTNVFTPDFCAPEQASAQSDAAMSQALGPWTDIYSLGATFYYLISHLVPPSAEMRLNSSPDPYKPLATRPDLCETYGEDFLKAIDRAMELAPADRWQNATAWRVSLEAGEYTIPPKVMRNIRIFGCLALIAFLIVGGLAIYAFSERSQLRAAYNSGLNLTESILYDFSTELTDIPGSSNLQKHLSANLQKYLTAMRDLPIGSDGRLDRSMAAAWFNIGCMHMSLGNLKDARLALQRAQEIETMICSKSPDDQRFHYELARTYLAQAELAHRSNQLAESATQAKAAVSILEKLYKLYPDNPNYGSSLGKALAFETFYLRNQGNHEARKQVLDRLLSIYKNLVQRFPRHMDSMMGYGNALHYCGRYAKDMEDFVASDRYLSESLKVFARLSASYPFRLSIKKGTAQVLHTMGELYYYFSLRVTDEENKTNYSTRAMEVLHDHIDLVRELRRLDSNNLDYVQLECRALVQVGNIMLLLGKFNEAEEQIRLALDNVEVLLSKEPSNTDYLAIKARALCSMALAHHHMPRHRAKAPRELAAGRALLEDHIATMHNPPHELLAPLMELYTHSAGVALDNGDKKQAQLWLEKAQDLFTQICQSDALPGTRQKLYKYYINQYTKRAQESAPQGT